MKRYLKSGIALLLPLALVFWVLMWLYDKGVLLVDAVVPTSWGTAWWYPILGVFAILVVIIIIGILFSWVKPLKWIYTKIETWVIVRIPFVNKLYGFGKEISDAFITDVKEDGHLTVVEAHIFGARYLGVLVDEVNHTIFVPTAPNPTNGFLFRTEDYKVLDMEYMDALKFVTSIGKINGKKWRN